MSIIGKIFQKAMTVRAWLGEESDGTSKFLSKGRKAAEDRLFDRLYMAGATEKYRRNLRTLGLGLRALVNVKCGRHELSSMVWLSQSRLRPLLSAQESDEIHRLKIASYNFFARPYWLCTWVCQELMLARDLTFYCSCNEICSEDLFRLHSSVSRSTPRIHPHRSDWRKWIGVAADPMMSSYQDGHSYFYDMRIPSAEVVSRFANTRCTDLRDKIYALLPLTNPSPGGPQLVADYSIGTCTLFLRTLEYRFQAEPKSVSWVVEWQQYALELTSADIQAKLDSESDLLRHIFKHRYSQADVVKSLTSNVDAVRKGQELMFTVPGIGQGHLSYGVPLFEDYKPT